jgi:hypothetical protein
MRIRLVILLALAVETTFRTAAAASPEDALIRPGVTPLDTSGDQVRSQWNDLHGYFTYGCDLMHQIAS